MTRLLDLMVTPPARSVAVAESLTCGHLQTQIGAISGASRFFRGGVTAYTLEAKVQLLGVNRAEAEACDCVSERVAIEMALGVRKLFSADYGLSTTGYAEPSPELGVTSPFAWWALAWAEGDQPHHRTGRLEIPGANRTDVQRQVAATVLAEFEKLLLSGSGAA